MSSIHGDRNGDILVELHAFRLGAELIWVWVFRVGREEGEGEAERLIFWSLAEEIECVVFVALGDVDLTALAVIIPMFARVGFGVVELLCREFAVVPLADLADVVAIGAKERGVSFFERGLPGSEASATVSGHPLTGEKSSATDAADRSGDAVLSEADSGFGEFIEVWCLNDGIARDSKGVVSPVIRKEDDDVHLFLSGGSKSQEAASKRGEKETERHDCD